MFPRLTMNLVACCIAGAMIQPSSAGTQQEYEVVIIEPWSSTYMFSFSSASGLNNLNQVSGGATLTPSGSASPFLWTFEFGKTQVALAGVINDNGIVVDGNLMMMPDGTIVEYTPMMGVSDINNSEVIVGPRILCMTGSDAKVWDEKNGIKSLFQDYGVWAAYASTAINDNNEIVGVRSWNDSCGDLEAFYFDLNTLEHIDIHAELLGTGMGITEAFDINNAGNVIGEGPIGGTVQPFLWHRDQGFTILPAAPGSIPMDTHFNSINNNNVAVGSAIVASSGWHAIIWDGVNGTRDLNNLIELPANFVFDSARQINDNGWIIGSGHYGAWSPERAVVLIPILTSIQGDVTGDGVVNVDDLLGVINAWGACPPLGDCDADIAPPSGISGGGNGLVDVDDLLMVIANWS